MTVNDSATPWSSDAELYLAYLRKLLISLAPIAVAGLIVIENAVDAGTPVRGVTWITALLAVIQAAATYFPGSAVAKAAASLVAVIGSTVIASLGDGHLTHGEVLVLAVQIFTWISASAVSNGAEPSVARKALGHQAGQAFAEGQVEGA